MPVNIKGKQYVTVAERIVAAHDAGVESIITEMLHYADSGIVFRATVRLKDGRTFTAHAEQSSSDAGIAGQSPLEVAETSAVGRALGFAGFGSADSIASADEVRNAPGARVPPPPVASQAPADIDFVPSPVGLMAWLGTHAATQPQNAVHLINAVREESGNPKLGYPQPKDTEGWLAFRGYALAHFNAADATEAARLPI